MGKKKIEKVNSSVHSALQDADSEIEELKEELQSWYDNLPENLQGGDKGSQLEEAIGQLESAQSFLQNVAVDDLPDINVEYLLPHRRATSRAKRLENAMAGVEAAVFALEEVPEATEEIESAIGELQSAIDEAGSVDFPGMY
jgi:DNA repair exonuclease SbcCD ATPase subunit